MSSWYIIKAIMHEISCHFQKKNLIFLWFELVKRSMYAIHQPSIFFHVERSIIFSGILSRQQRFHTEDRISLNDRTSRSQYRLLIQLPLIYEDGFFAVFPRALEETSAYLNKKSGLKNIPAEKKIYYELERSKSSEKSHSATDKWIFSSVLWFIKWSLCMDCLWMTIYIENIPFRRIYKWGTW